MKPMVKVKLAKRSDCDKLFKWARSKKNSSVNFLSHKKTLEQHRAWFKDIYSRHVCKYDGCEECPERVDILIGFEQNGKPIGVVTCSREGELRIFMTLGQHGKGWSIHLLWAAEDWIIRYRKQEYFDYLWADCGTDISERLFQRAGYYQMICGDYKKDI